MILNKEKLDIINNRIITLNLEYDELSKMFTERNDGNEGSKEWCQNAQHELEDILCQILALHSHAELLAVEG